jgi:hypothetical protein
MSLFSVINANMFSSSTITLMSIDTDEWEKKTLFAILVRTHNKSILIVC